MENKTFTSPVPPSYEANPSYPPPQGVSPMQTGTYDTTPAVAHHDPYNQGPPPSHPPPGGNTSPTQYPHQPIAPLGSQQHYANQPPAGSPPPQVSHAAPPPPQISHAAPPPAMVSPAQEKQEYYTPSGQTAQTDNVQTHPGMPPQQMSGGYAAPAASVYHTVTPLASLREGAAPVDCPVCHTRAMTRTEKHSGNTTHAWAALTCFFLCLGCIPYLITGLKDTEHFCGHCGVMLATYHNSGHTVVHQHG